MKLGPSSTGAISCITTSTCRLCTLNWCLARTARSPQFACELSYALQAIVWQLGHFLQAGTSLYGSAVLPVLSRCADWQQRVADHLSSHNFITGVHEASAGPLHLADEYRRPFDYYATFFDPGLRPG